MANRAPSPKTPDVADEEVLRLEAWLSGWRPDGRWVKRTPYHVFAGAIGCSKEHARRLAQGLVVPDVREAARIYEATAGAVGPDSFPEVSR